LTIQLNAVFLNCESVVAITIELADIFVLNIL